MFANTLILAFICLMAWWWGLAHGFFSAFLHLWLTIIAAVLAVALWEPLVLGLLIRTIPNYAWGVGLLGPFIAWLVVLRIAAALLVPSGIELGPGVNAIGGGACGFLSGILASGLTAMGVGFLPLPADAGGYQRVVIQEKWTVAPNAGGALWLPVDHYAEAFLSLISSGAFRSRYPFAQYQPDVITQASLYRLRYDPRSKMAAIPSSVRVADAYACTIPVSGLDEGFANQIGSRSYSLGNQLVVVQTKWQMTRDVFDADGVLRVPPTQVRLVCQQLDSKRPKPRLRAPVGWTQEDPTAGDLVFTSFDSSAKPVLEPDLVRERLLGWVFVIPVAEEPRFILVRRLRLGVPDLNADPEALVKTLGQPRDNGAGAGFAPPTTNSYTGRP